MTWVASSPLLAKGGPPPDDPGVARRVIQGRRRRQVGIHRHTHTHTHSNNTHTHTHTQAYTHTIHTHLTERPGRLSCPPQQQRLSSCAPRGKGSRSCGLRQCLSPPLGTVTRQVATGRRCRGCTGGPSTRGTSSPAGRWRCSMHDPPTTRTQRDDVQVDLGGGEGVISLVLFITLVAGRG